MTVSSEAKRTLVKSPPELWSELSDPESLARHLDGLEQVRITRVEPETAVEWEADGASGSVRLQPSGFGTKVTLSLSRELPPADSVATEPEPASESAREDAPAQLEPVAEPVTARLADVEPELEPPASESAISRIEPSETVTDEIERQIQPIAAEPDPITAESDPVQCEPTQDASITAPALQTPRQGLFARLFKRRRHKPTATAAEPVDAPREAEPVALVEPEQVPVVEAEPAATVQEAIDQTELEAPSEPLPDPAEVTPGTEQAVAPEPAPQPGQHTFATLAADLATLEAEMAEQDEAMLTAMLDRLGAAHHRPFSRS